MSRRNVSGGISPYPPTRCRCSTSTSMTGCWCLRRSVSHGSANVDAAGSPYAKNVDNSTPPSFSLVVGKQRGEAEEKEDFGASRRQASVSPREERWLLFCSARGLHCSRDVLVKGER